MKIIDAIDRFQRRHPVLAFPLAVIYKYFDDQGPYLAAIISYYAFIAVFPLLLISSSILGFVLQGDPELRDRLLDTALSQFPIVGDQLASEQGLQGSTSAIVVGSIVATYGAMGLGQAAQNAANIAWSVPRNSRANPFLMRLRSLIFLAIAGLGILALAIATSVLANPDAFGGTVGPATGPLVRGVGFVLTAAIFVGLFRLVSAGRATTRSVLPGALLATVGWQLLQLAGNTYVTNVINRASRTVDPTFALVLGLVAFIFVAAVMTVLGLELNVVLRRHLYPRALLTPFTDNVDLTDADKRAYTAYAKAQRHKGFEVIEARFEKPDDEDDGAGDGAGDEAGDGAVPPSSPPEPASARPGTA
ncbi:MULTISPECIES: YihY/virulence factor BrkB family protein [unclassified Aeromicrobium]|uniref:YihY/virulence factor BrkB family protein n=1 Tax=unclassified Aeromicrobium TaxID=2633570 RepID=UPI00288913B3|nr:MULTISPECIES: YihY/virulence factor BrkB family protein [unclassified Aeromicrobium]